MFFLFFPWSCIAVNSLTDAEYVRVYDSILSVTGILREMPHPFSLLEGGVWFWQISSFHLFTVLQCDFAWREHERILDSNRTVAPAISII